MQPTRVGKYLFTQLVQSFEHHENIQAALQCLTPYLPEPSKHEAQVLLRPVLPLRHSTYAVDFHPAKILKDAFPQEAANAGKVPLAFPGPSLFMTSMSADEHAPL